jgi:hypothetical protein
MPAGQFLERIPPIRPGVVDGLIGAIANRKIALLGRRRGGDHPRAHQSADLNGGDADAAGRAQHQQDLAFAQRRPGIQRVKPG